MELNERIKKYRKEAGLSQEDLASKIYVSRTLITKYESGSAFPTQENLIKIAAALKHSHTRTFCSSINRLTDVNLSVQAFSLFITEFLQHINQPYLTPVLPTLRLITSVSYRIPFPL